MKNLNLKYILVAVFAFAMATACEEDKNEFSIIPAIGFNTTGIIIDSEELEPVNAGFYSNTRLTEPVTLTVGVSTVGNATYGVDFTTEPEPIANTITVVLDPESETPGIIIHPMANPAAPEVRKVNLEILSVSGNGLELPQAAARTFSLTMTKVQLDPNQLTIADVRAMYTGSAMVISTDKFIEGVVISTNDNVTSKNVYLQDNTAGIVLRFNVSNLTDPGKVALGDHIRIPVKDVTLTAFNGLLQMGDGTSTLPHSKVQKLGTKTLPAVKTVTVAQLNSNQYQSQRVRVENVTFTGADGSKTVSGNTTFSDATGSATMRVESYAPFSGKILPSGAVTLTGIASTFTSAQLVPVSESDIQ